MSRSDNKPIRLLWNGVVTGPHHNFYNSLTALISNKQVLEACSQISEDRWNRMVVKIQRDIAKDAEHIPEVLSRAATEGASAYGEGGFNGTLLSSGHTARFHINPAELARRVRWAPLATSTLKRKERSGGRGRFFVGRTGNLQQQLRNMRPWAADANRVKYSYTPGAKQGFSFYNKVIGSGTIDFSPAMASQYRGAIWNAVNDSALARTKFEISMLGKGDPLLIAKLSNPEQDGKPRAYRPLLFPVVAFFTQVRYPALAKRILRQEIKR